MGAIRVGTASWTDPSLVKSGWYPPGTDSAEARLQHYASRFPLVEVDATYYFPPTKKNAELWAQRTQPGFLFNIKAFSMLTGHPTRAEALPKDVDRPEGKARVYPKDLADKDVARIWDDFGHALGPLVEADRLGAVLFQYPPWFGISRKNKAFVLECARRMAPLPICVEFRNGSWLDDDNQRETLDLLEGHGLPLVCVDMPQGFKSSVPPVLAATADLAMVRFHGHNDDEWESGSVQRRFRYLYSDDELEQWAPKVADLAAEARQTHVLMNNCHSDYAPRNAADLARMLDQLGADVVAPFGAPD